MRKAFRPIAATLLAAAGFGLLGCVNEQIILDAKAAAGLRIGSLTFSGDEKHLGYSAGDWTSSPATSDSGNVHIVTVPPSGKPKEVDVRGCNVNNVYRLRWANKKKMVAYAARDAIYTVASKGKKWDAPKDLVPGAKSCQDAKPGPGEITSLGWSPDDDKIAFSTADKKIGILDVDGGQKETIFEGSDRLTILAWSPQGIVTKEGRKIISIDPVSKQKVEKTELAEDVDWVTATPKGVVFVVTQSGKVQEIRASGPKTIHTLQAKLKPKAKGKKKAAEEAAQHKFVAEISPSGHYLAVAEQMADKEDSGSSILSLVTLPAPAKPEAKKDKKVKKKAKVEDEGEAAPSDEAPKASKKKAKAAEEESAAESAEPAAPSDEASKAPKKKAKEEQAPDADEPK